MKKILSGRRGVVIGAGAAVAAAALGVAGYRQLRPAAIEMRVPEVSGAVLAAGYDHVIAMKAAAGRGQDLIDIDALQRARGECD